MNTFLEFLNLADLETLMSLPGMTETLAKRMIAARPFEMVEDALKVRGMSKNLLASLQTSFLEQKLLAPVPARAVEIVEPDEVTEEKPAALPVRAQPARSQQSAASGPGFGERLGQALINVLGFIFGLFVLLIVIAVIGSGVYFGLPYLNERYVVPVEQNTTHLSALATQQAGDVQRLSADLNALKTQLDAATTRLDALDQTLTDQSATLAELEKIQSTLDEAASRQRDTLLVELRHQVMLMRAIEMLSRGRLYLSQSNFGLAKQDVQSARDLLAELQADVPDYQASHLETAISRLDLALGNLPAFPVVAVNDVDIAWNLLVAGLPESAAAATAIATPTGPAPSETPTAAPTPTLVPTATLPVTPTP